MIKEIIRLIIRQKEYELLVLTQNLQKKWRKSLESSELLFILGPLIRVLMVLYKIV